MTQALSEQYAILDEIRKSMGEESRALSPGGGQLGSSRTSEPMFVSVRIAT